jgi:hypothetical protein
MFSYSEMYLNFDWNWGKTYSRLKNNEGELLCPKKILNGSGSSIELYITCMTISCFAGS